MVSAVNATFKIRSLMAREKTYLEREKSFLMREQTFLAKESNIPRRECLAPGAEKMLVRMPTICIGPSVEELHKKGSLMSRVKGLQQGDLPPIDMFSSRMQVRLKFIESQRYQRETSTVGDAKLSSRSEPAKLNRR